MSGEPLTLTAVIRVREGCEERFLAAAFAVIPPTRAEAGCVEYRLHRNDERPGTFSFYEIWRTDEDLDHHMKTPHIAAFIAAIEPILDSEIALERWRAVEPTRVSGVSPGGLVPPR
jgi:quinol monooxygenase YgiN